MAAEGLVGLAADADGVAVVEVSWLVSIEPRSMAGHAQTFC